MMGRNIQQNIPAKQWAVAQNTFTAAGSATITPTLPGGATGKPVRVRASGSVAGYATLNIGTQAQVVVLINPNAPYTEEPIPAAAFPSPVGSAPIVATASGAGVVTVALGFA